MTVVALASVKGSPGVTTAATALAAAWPTGRQVLLVEADPFGGDLAPRYGSTVTGGLASLFAAARRTLTPEAVWASRRSSSPVAFPSCSASPGSARPWPTRRPGPRSRRPWPGSTPTSSSTPAGCFPSSPADRRRPRGGRRPGRPVRLRRSRRSSISETPCRASSPRWRGRQLLVVPTGSAGYSARTTSPRPLEVTVGPALPDDPGRAARWPTGAASRGSSAPALLGGPQPWSRALGVDAAAIDGSRHDAVREELPPRGWPSTSRCPRNRRAHSPIRLGCPRPSAAPVGAGSKWEARP